MNKFKLKLSRQWRGLLLNKSADLLIVILGVTIAFQLSNIKQRSDLNAQEHFYIENLVTDIDKDVSTINKILNQLQSDNDLASICLSRPSGAISLDTLGRTVISIMSFDTFNYRNDNTYTTLMNSHGLNIITNKDARNLISEYYKCYKSIDRFEYVYTEFLLNYLHPYFTPFIDYSTGKITNPTILEDTQTMNSLVIVRGQLNDGIETYKNALVKAAELRKTLNKML
jgi:hypothetical protein